MDRLPDVQEAPPINLDLIKPGAPMGYSDWQGNRVVFVTDTVPDKKGGRQTVATVLIRSVNGSTSPTFTCYQGVVNKDMASLRLPSGEMLQIFPYRVDERGYLAIKPPKSMGKLAAITDGTELTHSGKGLKLYPDGICQVQMNEYGLRLPLHGSKNRLHPIRLKFNDRGVPTLNLPKSNRPGEFTDFEISNGLPVFISVGANGDLAVSREKPAGRECVLLVRQGNRFLIENTGVDQLEINMNTRAAFATLPKPGNASADCQDGAYACMWRNGGGGLLVVDAMGGTQELQEGVDVKNIIVRFFTDAVTNTNIRTAQQAKLALLDAYEASRREIQRRFGGDFRGGAVATAAINLGNEFVFFHIGDTRLYKVNVSGDITCLTTDHNDIPPDVHAILDDATGRNDPRLTEDQRDLWDRLRVVTRAISLAPTMVPDIIRLTRDANTWGWIAITDGKESLQEGRFKHIVQECVASGQGPDWCATRIAELINLASRDERNPRQKRDDVGVAILLAR